MTYLAEIVKAPQFNSKAIASLLGQKRLSDGLWIGVSSKEIAINNRDVYLKQLILLELNSIGSVEFIVSANEVLVTALTQWSVRLTKHDSEVISLQLLQKSLEYQSVKFHQKEQELKRREDLLKQQEKILESLLTSAQEKLNNASSQHEALKGAWEHLNYREQQLKNL